MVSAKSSPGESENVGINRRKNPHVAIHIGDDDSVDEPLLSPFQGVKPTTTTDTAAAVVSSSPWVAGGPPLPRN